jgi:carbonic anhydrase/acetyltransferase-like protein (isoleucine patch superfamily)
MPIIEFKGKKPKIDANAFVMNSATLIGDVVISSNVLVLANAVLRGDFNQVYIGENVYILENSVLHPVIQDPITLEGHSIVGYGAKVHGGAIKKGVFIGTNSVILRGVEIGEDSLIAAGSILTVDMKIPPRSVVMGAPAKIVRELGDDGVKWIKGAVAGYMGLLEDYKTELKEWEIRYGR